MGPELERLHQGQRTSGPGRTGRGIAAGAPPGEPRRSRPAASSMGRGTNPGLVGLAFMEEDGRLNDSAVRGIMDTSEVRSTGVNAAPAIGRSGRRPWRILAAALVAGAVLLSAGCSGDD